MPRRGGPHPDSGDDLADLLGRESPVAARVRRLTLTLPMGPWNPEEVPPARRSPLGLLVLSGFVARDVELAGHSATEILGPGDICAPWAGLREEDFLPAEMRWAAFVPSQILVLDPGLGELIRSRRGLHDAFCGAVARRTSSLAVQRAIAQLPRVELRLLSLLWHLAGRWGRVTPNGIVVPLALSHAFLGRLVGARRPTVTLAARELSERGHAVRRDDGTWQLGSEAPQVLQDGDGLPRRKRPESAGRSDPIDRLARDLARHAHGVREETATPAAVK
jgi:CRP/FNR family cyclic AMP-dependent transcriptional regulator